MGHGSMEMQKSAKDTTSKVLNGTSKIDAYKWVCVDKPGKFAMIPKGDILIDEDYQRDANGGKILSLARSWSWIACGAIIIGKRDGKFWAIDGQHRLLAAMKRDDIKEMPCIVFPTNSQREEAQGFLDGNGNRRPVGAVAKFHAMVVAGDETAIYVKGALDRYKINLQSNWSGMPGNMKCIAAALRMATVNRERFERVFSFMVKLCQNSMFIHEKLLLALDHIDGHCGDGLSDKRLSARIIDAGPGRLIEGINRASAYFAKGGSKIWAQGVLDVINKGLSNRFELDPVGDKNKQATF